MDYFSNKGYYVVAPDMRGYGNSSVYNRYEDYCMEEIVKDMLQLLQCLNRPNAIWIGHDWGAPVVWSIASHHPEVCRAIANLCVPYYPNGFAPENLIPLVNRDIYPLDSFPAGQWDYQLYYTSHFEEGQKAFEADISRTFRAFMRSGNPAGEGKPGPTATLQQLGGWFGGAGIAPDVPADPAVLTTEDLQEYINAFSKNGFFGPNAWYMNAERNIKYAQQSVNGGVLSLPVLFLHAAYDWICDTLHSKLADPMRTFCTNLREETVYSGHWMVQEKPDDVNRFLENWMQQELGL